MVGNLIDKIDTATHKELLVEYEKCEEYWGECSYDCFGFYVQALHKRIVELGCWPT